MVPVAGLPAARALLLVPHPPPSAPYTDAYLRANLVCRVVLALLANAGCWVPLRNLCRRGELAPAVLVGTVVAANCLAAANALVWRDDDVHRWWDGRVWCDLHAYLYQPLVPLYWLSVVATTRNLAQQMSLSRAGPPSGRERRRKTLVQALIVFPLPLAQAALLYPLSSRRYSILTLTGCTWSSRPSWPLFVFFLAPRLPLVLASVYYAVLTWRRYCLIAQVTRSALVSNSSAASRAKRTRWRLFLVMVCILALYGPVECYATAAQLKAFFLSSGFDLHGIRQQVDPLPWDTVLLLPSGSLSFLELNHQYLVIATAAPVFYFFGLTEDATRTYRRALRAVGLGSVFPRLREGPASGRTDQRAVISLQADTDLALTKSADDGSQHAHVRHVSNARSSAPSPPPFHQDGPDSPTGEILYPAKAQQAVDDSRSPVSGPGLGAVIEHGWVCTLKVHSLHLPRRTRLRPDSPLYPQRHSDLAFLDAQSVVPSPAEAHLPIRSWPDEDCRRVACATRVACLPPLA